MGLRHERRKLEIFLRKKRYDRIRYKKTITTTILFYLLFAIPVLAGQYPVTHVVDGDTIDVIYQGHKERSGMLNVNTPESVYPDQSRNTEMGRRASAYTESRPGGETVFVVYPSGALMSPSFIRSCVASRASLMILEASL